MIPPAPRRFAPRRPDPRRSAGFTLVELVLVVMVLGVMAGIAAPRFQTAMTGVHLEATAKRLAADLRRAQAVAMSQSTSVLVSIDPATETYSCAALTDLDRNGSTLTVNVAQREYGVQIASSSFGAGTDVAFDFRGEPVDAGSVTISAGSLTAVVSVNSVGLVEVTL